MIPKYFPPLCHRRVGIHSVESIDILAIPYNLASGFGANKIGSVAVETASLWYVPCESWQIALWVSHLHWECHSDRQKKHMRLTITTEVSSLCEFSVLWLEVWSLALTQRKERCRLIWLDLMLGDLVRFCFFMSWFVEKYPVIQRPFTLETILHPCNEGIPYSRFALALADLKVYSFLDSRRHCITWSQFSLVSCLHVSRKWWGTHCF